jgi:hypothetical protein
MSFFGYMAAGLAEGAGRGISQEADLADRRAAALELQREKQAGAQKLARQRDQDRADRERDNIALRAEMRSGGRSGGKGDFNLFEQTLNAATPEQQSRLVETVRAYQGDDAANVIERVFGRQASAAANPSAGDFARFDRGQTEALPTAAAAPSTDAEKGRVGLQRLLALAMDPSKLDAYSKGERQIGMNDRAAAAAEAATGGADDKAETFNQLSNPRVNLAGNDLAKQRIDAMTAAEEGKNKRLQQQIDSREDLAGKRASAREIEQAERAVAAARKLQVDADLPSARRAADAAVAAAEARLKELKKPMPAAAPEPTWIPDAARQEQRRIIESELQKARASGSRDVPELERELARLGGPKPAAATAPNRRDLFKVIR